MLDHAVLPQYRRAWKYLGHAGLRRDWVEKCLSALGYQRQWVGDEMPDGCVLELWWRCAGDTIIVQAWTDEGAAEMFTPATRDAGLLSPREA